MLCNMCQFLWDCVRLFNTQVVSCSFKTWPSVPRSNVRQLVVNSLLASQSRNHEANNITVVKI